LNGETGRIPAKPQQKKLFELRCGLCTSLKQT
jgi:hypothetical protein